MDGKVAGDSKAQAYSVASVTEDLQANGMFGSNPQFQGQQADASWCSDIGSWVAPNGGSGCFQTTSAESIDWQSIDEALEKARRMEKVTPNHVSRATPEQPPLATLSPQQLTASNSLPIPQSMQRSDDATLANDSGIPSLNKVVVLPAPRAGNIASPGIKRAVPVGKLKTPQHAVHKAVGPRDHPIPAKVDVAQQSIMSAQLPSRPNGSGMRGRVMLGPGRLPTTGRVQIQHHPEQQAVAYRNSGPGVSARALARHLIRRPQAVYAPRPRPRYAPKPGNCEGEFVPALQAAHFEIRRLRGILQRHKIRY